MRKTHNSPRVKKSCCPRRTLRLMGYALFLAAQPAPAAVVTQYTYSTTCKPNPAYALWGDCSTLDHLYQRAKTWTRQYPKPLAGSTPATPSIVLVTSTTIPISAIFRFYNPPPMRTSHGTLVYPPPLVSYFQPARTGNLVTDTYAAARLDRQVTATRALKITPVRMPVERGTAQAHVGVVSVLNATFERQSSGLDFLWGLAGYHMPQTRYLDVIDERSGEQHRIFLDDTITIIFADLSSLVVKLTRKSPTDPALIFAVVAGSERNAAGKPYTVVPNITAQPGNGSQWVAPGPHTSGRLLGTGPACTFPAGQVCVSGEFGTAKCANTRAYTGPC